MKGFGGLLVMIIVEWKYLGLRKLVEFVEEEIDIEWEFCYFFWV